MLQSTIVVSRICPLLLLLAISPIASAAENLKANAKEQIFEFRTTCAGVLETEDGTEPSRILVHRNDTVELWDIKNQSTILQYNKTPRCKFLVLSPDQKTFITNNYTSLSSRDYVNSVQQWDIATGQLLNEFSVGKLDLDKASFSRDGTLVTFTTTGSRETAHVYRVDDGAFVTKVDEGMDYITRVAIDSHLMTASRDGFLRYWDLASGTEVRRVSLEVGGRKFAPVDFSPDFKFAAVGTSYEYDQQSFVSVIDLASGAVLWTNPAFHEVVHAVRFTADGTKVMASGGNLQFKVWNADGDEQRQEYIPYIYYCGRGCTNPAISHIQFIQNDKFVLTVAKNEPTARIWRMTSDQTARMDLETEAISHQVTSDNATVVSSDLKGVFSRWDVATGALQSTTTIANDAHEINYYTEAAISADGKFAYYQHSYDSAAIQYDLATGKELKRFALGGRPRGFFRLLPDGQSLIYGFQDSNPDEYRVATTSMKTGEVSVWAPAENAYFVAGAVDAAGRFLATASYDVRVKIWDINKQKILHDIAPPDGVSRSAKLAFVGKNRLAALYTDLYRHAVILKIFDVKIGAEVRSVTLGASAYAGGLAASADGKYVAISTQLENSPGILLGPAARDGLNQTIIVNVETGEQVQRLIGHINVPMDLMFLSNNRFISAGGKDQSIRVWDLKL